MYFGISIALFLIFTIYKSKKAMHMLQQNYYDESNRYLFWMFKNLKKVFFNSDILYLLLLILLFINIDTNIVIIIYSLLTLFIFISYRNNVRKEQSKKPLVVTSRIKRLLFT